MHIYDVDLGLLECIVCIESLWALGNWYLMVKESVNKFPVRCTRADLNPLNKHTRYVYHWHIFPIKSLRKKILDINIDK